jgi:hypothetical protein
MKLRYAIITTLALSGHTAWAEDTAEANAGAAVQPAVAEKPAEKAVTDKQIEALETDVSPSLQSKLDALMSFDVGPVEASRQEVASAH